MGDAPAPVVGELHVNDLGKLINNNGRAPQIDRERVLARIQELQQLEANALAELHAIQGAIAELQTIWLPWLEKAQDVKGQSALEPIRNAAE